MFRGIPGDGNMGQDSAWEHGTETYIVHVFAVLELVHRGAALLEVLFEARLVFVLELYNKATITVSQSTR